MDTSKGYMQSCSIIIDTWTEWYSEIMKRIVLINLCIPYGVESNIISKKKEEEFEKYKK